MTLVNGLGSGTDGVSNPTVFVYINHSSFFIVTWKRANQPRRNDNDNDNDNENHNDNDNNNGNDNDSVITIA